MPLIRRYYTPARYADALLFATLPMAMPIAASTPLLRHDDIIF